MESLSCSLRATSAAWRKIAALEVRANLLVMGQQLNTQSFRLSELEFIIHKISQDIKIMVEAKKSNTTNFHQGILGDFNLSLKLDDSELLIEAENPMNGRLFRISLTNEHVSTVSLALFREIGELYRALIEALVKKSPSITISIDENGKILYKVDLMVGTMQLDRKFEITLEDQKLGENTRLARMVENLSRKVLEQEKIINEQTKITKALEDKIQAKTLEDKIQAKALDDEMRIKALEDKMLAKALQDEIRIKALEDKMLVMALEYKTLVDPSLEFDSASPNISYYLLLNLGKTVESKNVNVWRPILAKNPLPKSKVTSFSVRVDYTKSSNIMIGICPTSLKNFTSAVNSTNGCISYFPYGTGYIYNKGSSSSVNSGAAKANTVITVTTDLIKNKVSFYFEDKLIQTVDLDSSFVQTNDYYPYVDLATTNDRVSLISYKVQE